MKKTITTTKGQQINLVKKIGRYCIVDSDIAGQTYSRVVYKAEDGSNWVKGKNTYHEVFCIRGQFTLSEYSRIAC